MVWLAGLEPAISTTPKWRITRLSYSQWGDRRDLHSDTLSHSQALCCLSYGHIEKWCTHQDSHLGLAVIDRMS